MPYVFPDETGLQHVRHLRPLDQHSLDRAGPRGRDQRRRHRRLRQRSVPGTNCIKIGLPGKRILSKRKGLGKVLFS